jgi:hypothetical protein
MDSMVISCAYFLILKRCRLKVIPLHLTFGPKAGKVIRGWRELYKEELHNLCSLISGDEMNGACSMHIGNKKLIQDFSQKTEMEETTWETDKKLGKKILKLILKKYDLRLCSELN